MTYYENYVHAKIDGILLAQGPKSFIFQNENGNHVIPFSQCLMITLEDGDVTVEQLQADEFESDTVVESVQIRDWLARKLELEIIDE